MKKDSAKKNDKKKAVVKQTKKKKGVFKAIKNYFKGVKKEIGRIRWSSGKDLVKYSFATLVFVLFFGVYFYIIDMLVALIRSIA